MGRLATLLLLSLFAIPAPLAAAEETCTVPIDTPLVAGCAGNHTFGDMACESEPMGYRATGVSVHGEVAGERWNAFVGGKSECLQGWPSWEGVQVGVWIAGNFWAAQWGTIGGTCEIRTFVMVRGCPAGMAPPDPGWGHLLP